MKNKTIFVFLISLFICLSINTVNASDSINYTLTITDDFEFKEVINYRIENYESPKNGYNYMTDIINNDVYADVLGKTTYEKQKSKKNGVYYVTLTKTFNEYTMSNSAFLNNCFQKPNYKYDIKKYSFSGSGGFNCYDATDMTLTIITNFEVTSTNATIEGNKYIWKPANANFAMNINMNKQYKEAEQDPSVPYDDIDEPDDSEDKPDNENSNSENTNNETTKKKSNIPTYIFAAVSFTIVIGLVFIVPILKKKNSSLDEI